MNKKVLFTLALAASAVFGQSKLWIAMGTSITDGGCTHGDFFPNGCGNPLAYSRYPDTLQKLLKGEYKVENYGHGGAVIARRGVISYWSLPKLKEILAKKPDVISLEFGTNDARDTNAVGLKITPAEFERDYRALLDTLGTLSPKPRLVLCAPLPVFKGNWIQSDSNLLAETYGPIIRKIAKEKGHILADLHQRGNHHPLIRTMLPDGVHPWNAMDSVGRWIHDAFVGQVPPDTGAVRPRKWSCLGTSITEGRGDPANYTSKLQALLGSGFQVLNRGVSTATAIKATTVSVWENGSLQKVLNDKPDVVSIEIGTNDALRTPLVLPKVASFEAHYRALVDTLLTLKPAPRILVCLPIPIKKLAWASAEYPQGLWDSARIVDEFNPIIRKIAGEKRLTVVDLYTPLHRTVYVNQALTDGVHPYGPGGYDSIAAIIHRTYASTTPTGLSPASRPHGAETGFQVVAAGGRMELRFSEPLSGEVELFSFAGAKVWSVRVSGARVLAPDLPLPAGVYWLRHGEGGKPRVWRVLLSGS